MHVFAPKEPVTKPFFSQPTAVPEPMGNPPTVDDPTTKESMEQSSEPGPIQSTSSVVKPKPTKRTRRLHKRKNKSENQNKSKMFSVVGQNVFGILSKKIV